MNRKLISLKSTSSKKFLIFAFPIFFLVILTTGCESDEFTFQPPSWIIGTWLPNDGLLDLSIKFTQDNIIYTFNSMSLDYKEYANSGNVSSAEENANTDTEYTVTLHSNDTAATTKMRLVKRSDSSISYYSSSTGMSFGAIILYKQ